MYLSLLSVETHARLGRPRYGRRWVGNPYRVHQRLCMAFPDIPRINAQPHKEGMAPPHVSRDHARSVLFRIDSDGPTPRVLVQSVQEPCWEHAFGNAEFLLTQSPGVKEFHPVFEPGQRLRFLLRANPTVKRPKEDARNGARYALTEPDQQIAWLQRKSEPGGFRVLQVRALCPGRRISRRSRQIEPGIRHTHFSVDFAGLLGVT